MHRSVESAVAQIPFVDLDHQRRLLEPGLRSSIDAVLSHGRFIMGPEVQELEERLARYCGAAAAITCSSGTDGLLMSLMAAGVQSGDAVFVPSFTFASTAEAVAISGATPVFVDVKEDDYTVDPAQLLNAITEAARWGLHAKGVITVDLFGQPADYGTLETIVEDFGLVLIADAAQSFGASFFDRRVGSIGHLSVTSFFPSKPLGCYGDGGAVFTDDAGLAEALRSVRVHGQGKSKYDNTRIGLNARLDTLQAAVLLQKLDIFDAELLKRREVARRYGQFLTDAIAKPFIRPEVESAWAQYTIEVDPAIRSGIMERMRQQGIPTAIYYEKPLHLQPAYSEFPNAGSLAVSERVSDCVLSLPMHPYLDEATQVRIAEALESALAALSS